MEDTTMELAPTEWWLIKQSFQRQWLIIVLSSWDTLNSPLFIIIFYRLFGNLTTEESHVWWDQLSSSVLCYYLLHSTLGWQRAGPTLLCTGAFRGVQAAIWTTWVCIASVITQATDINYGSWLYQDHWPTHDYTGHSVNTASGGYCKHYSLDGRYPGRWEPRNTCKSHCTGNLTQEIYWKVKKKKKQPRRVAASAPERNSRKLNRVQGFIYFPGKGMKLFRVEVSRLGRLVGLHVQRLEFSLCSVGARSSS